MQGFQELSKGALDELTKVFERVDEKGIRNLLDKIKSADRIFLLGAGREGISTKAFAMRLMHLGKDGCECNTKRTGKCGCGLTGSAG